MVLLANIKISYFDYHSLEKLTIRQFNLLESSSLVATGKIN